MMLHSVCTIYHVIFLHRHVTIQMYALDDGTAITGNQLASLIRGLSEEARSMLSELGFVVEVRPTNSCILHVAN